MVYELLSQSGKLNKQGGGRRGGRGRNKSGGLKNFLKKISEGAVMTLARDPRVIFL